uniref:Putative salivary lipocalin n=1 Tax=Ixodes ricinus TaxID=34613 RepID=A0A0K8R8N6_IXORI
MARPVQAALLCLVLKLSLAEAGFEEAVEYIYDNSQAIRLLFLEPKNFYVVGGTFEEDPLLKKDSGLPFKCGEVKTGKISNEMFSMERRIYTERLTGKWLQTMYDMTPGTSEGYNFSNYMEASRHQGNTKIYSGTIYLLLSDSDSCALFYHKETDDCELWEKKRPEKDGLPTSFCSRYIRACNNKTVQYYHKYSECHPSNSILGVLVG